MGLKAQLEAAMKRGREIIEGAKGRSMTDDERAELKSLTEEAEGLKTQIEAEEEAAELIKQFGGSESPADIPSAGRAKTLGDHFVKQAGDRIASLKNRGSVVTTTEYKANTDTVVTGGADSSAGVLMTDVDRTIVTEYRRPTVADVFGTGTISGQAITYFVEGETEGDVGMVEEAGAKPQLSMALPTAVTDRLKEVAGWIRVSDDMVDDLPFLVSEINGRLTYKVLLREEAQLLNGDGSGNNLLGVLNRSGIQTESSAGADDNADALFRAATKIQTVTGLSADALLIHPTDYQSLRLARDANEQYYGGGFFAGQYGNGGIDWQPPVWGLRTVVTPAVAVGTPVVGAFKVATTVYRKGGLRIEATNSHEDDFTNDRIVIRAKERLALAVRRPSAIVKVTLGGSDD